MLNYMLINVQATQYDFAGGDPMGQVTIYIDAEIEKKMTAMVKKSGKSKSKWISELIREKTASSWPENFVKLAGAWADMPTAEEIRKDLGSDVPREAI